MKKFKFALFAFMVSMMAFTFASCSDDDEVKDVSVTGVTIAPQTLDLKEGTTGTLTASVAPTNATKKTVSWTSSDEKVATVDNGTVTAVAEGTATITVRTDEGGFTATATVNVTKDIPPFDESKYHFDLFLTVDKHGGMSAKNITIANSTASLKADRGTITVVREGAELGYYTMESISKGKYYYQVYSSKGTGAGDRFVKYQIKENKVIDVQSQRVKSNTFNARSYTHAWLDDNTLVIMSSNGDKSKIIWTKLNANDMTILDEGELSEITLPEGWTSFTTSGILTYRPTDNKLFYFYFAKKIPDPNKPRFSVNEPNFRVAVIDPATMKVETECLSSRIRNGW
ncbi:MAG: Ig-like domain-containing protein [Phocaeicola vulgatus]|nr:MAG: Ig-like domain-containing protein [Phocaeicola vulgatus]